MRIGMLARGEVSELDRAQRLGFRSIEWVSFDKSPCGVAQAEWRPYAETLAGEAAARGIRISAIAALYRNPLDPRQTDHARATFQRAIEVAAHIGVKTVTGFAGGVIRTHVDERGGNPVYEPFENFLPELLAFWEPVADFAAERGVRIAFEHCPQAQLPLPIMGFNMLARVAMWERLFAATRCANLGLEWDPSHLICQFIDPVENLRLFGSRVFHVHAKDARINRPLLARYGICHPGVAEHRVPGLGDANWAEIVHTLLRMGYDSDLNVEGMHDPVYRDHREDEPGPLAGRKLEEAGLLIGRQTLEVFVPRED